MSPHSNPARCMFCGQSLDGPVQLPIDPSCLTLSEIGLLIPRYAEAGDYLVAAAYAQYVSDYLTEDLQHD